MPQPLPRTAVNPAAPLVSVIVPTYNRPAFLEKCLASLCEQTFQDFEVIVVNDGGVPVESIVRAHGPAGRTHYLALGANRDRSAARNHALRVARGRYIAYLDDDDRFLPEHLEVLVTELETGTRVAYTDARRLQQQLAGDEYVTIASDVPYSRDFDATQLLLTNYIPIVCVAHERVLLDEVGLFDENLRVLEDWDLWIRMSRVTAFVHLPKVTCEFSSRVDGSSTTSSSADDLRSVEQEIFIRYLRYTAAVPEAKLALHGYQTKYFKRLVLEGRAAEAAALIERVLQGESDSRRNAAAEVTSEEFLTSCT